MEMDLEMEMYDIDGDELEDSDVGVWRCMR